jgi:hypothetical protein
MRFPAPALLVGGARRTEARDEAETGAGPEGGVERGGAAWGEARSRCRGAGGWRGAGGGLARLLQGSPFLTTPTKEAHHEVGRSDHDFTQHSEIRRRTSVSEVVPGWKGLPLGKASTRKGTATDYGCCAMAMVAGSVTSRTL